MIIYIDENLPPVVAEALHKLQEPLNVKNKLRDPIQVKSIKSVFGQGALDEDWIPKLDKNRDCVITQDYNIKRIHHQRELYEAQGLGMIYLRPPSKTGFDYWQQVTLIIKHWEEITKKASREKRPFSFKVNPRSSKLDKL